MLAIFSCCLTIVLHRKIHERSTIAAISLLVIVVILIFPIGGLFGFHIVLISNGRTTNEHVTGKYRGNNFFSRGFCQNFLHLFCGSLTPQLKGVRLIRKRKLNNDENNKVVIDSRQISPSSSKNMHRGNISDNSNDSENELQSNNRKDPDLSMKKYKFNRKTSLSSNDSISSASMLNQNTNKSNNS